jgi:molybdenum storage protein
MTDRPDPAQVADTRHLASRLTAQSLQSRAVLRETDSGLVRALLPHLTVIKIGGSSILDRGPDAVMPVIEQIAELADEHPLLICAGEGARARHAYAIAADLGLPPGMLSILGNSVAEQNALIIGALLMHRGAVNVPTALVPTLLNGGAPVVISGMPPFEWWEPPPPGPGPMPEYRTDAGAFLMAEAFGAQTVIYVKDQDSLCTTDPATDPDAHPIARITASELQRDDLPSLPLEPVVVSMLIGARLVQRVQLVNGLAAGTVVGALRGEPIGTIITAG